MKFKLYEDEWDLNQIYQTVDTTFALGYKNLSGEYEQVHPFVKCRDYFNDVWFEDKFDMDLGRIYGFNLNTEEYPGITEDVNLFVKFYIDNNFDTYFRKYMKLFREFEKECGLSPTRTYNVEEQGDYKILMLKADSEWYSSPATMSLYTFFIRAITSFSNKTQNKNFKNFSELLKNADDYSVKSYYDALRFIDLKKFVSNMSLIFQDLDSTRIYSYVQDKIDNEHVEHLHDSSGILSFSYSLSPYIDEFSWSDKKAAEFLETCCLNRNTSEFLYRDSVNQYYSIDE